MIRQRDKWENVKQRRKKKLFEKGTNKNRNQNKKITRKKEKNKGGI